MPLQRTKLHEKIQKYLLYGVVISLFFPNHPAINSICLILLVLNWIVEGKFAQKILRLRQNIALQILFLFYFLHIVGLWHTQNIARGLFDLQVKLPLLFLPLVLGTIPKFTSREFENIFKAFLLGLTIMISFCLGIAIYKTYTQPIVAWMQYFTYHYLGSPVGLHAANFSILVIIGFYIVVYFLHKYWKKYSLKTIILALFYIFCLVFVLFLLAIRTQLLAFVLSIFGFILWLFYQHQKLQRGILISCLLAILFFAVIYLNPLTYHRFADALNLKKVILLDKNKDNSLGKTWDGRALRLAQWQCAISVIEKNWLFGVGTGDCFDELQKSYQEHKFYFASQYNSYDTHNQYLETAMGLGILSLIVLLVWLFIHIWNAWQSHSFVYFMLIFCFMLGFITENLLCRNQSVVFFSIFVALFDNYYTSSPTPDASHSV